MKQNERKIKNDGDDEEEGASLLNFVLSPARNPKQAQRRGGVVEVAEWERTESGDTEFLP